MQRFILLLIVSFCLVTGQVASAAEACSCAGMNSMATGHTGMGDMGMGDCAKHCEKQGAANDPLPMKCDGGACQCCSAAQSSIVPMVTPHPVFSALQKPVIHPVIFLTPYHHDIPYQPPKRA